MTYFIFMSLKLHSIVIRSHKDAFGVLADTTGLIQRETFTYRIAISNVTDSAEQGTRVLILIYKRL